MSTQEEVVSKGIANYHAAVEAEAKYREQRKHQFTYKVTVYAATLAEAEQVMAERLDCDEDYGFPYQIDWMYQ